MDCRQFAVRRGWYLGERAFGERLLAMAGETLAAGRAASYSGAAKRAHGEAEAERMLARGLRALDLETAALPDLPKGTPEKQALAWWLCQRTTVRRRWVSERLAMGDESRVTQAIRRVNANRDQDLIRCQHQLTQLLNADEDLTNGKLSLFRD